MNKGLKVAKIGLNLIKIIVYYKFTYRGLSLSVYIYAYKPLKPHIFVKIFSNNLKKRLKKIKIRLNFLLITSNLLTFYSN